MVKNNKSLKSSKKSPANGNPQIYMSHDLRSSSVDNNENPERGNWTNKLDFILSCLGYAVGLGNIWRFPYLCYRNGGGAFLIPYFLMLLLTGFPLFFMELSFGQFASETPITIWKISPLFQGLGYGMFIISCLVGIYYNMILAWAIFYLYASLTSSLPWRNCDNEWNTSACKKLGIEACFKKNGTILENGTCLMDNSTDFFSNISNHIKLRSPSDEYFHRYVLNISEGLDNIGGIQWSLALCLFVAWFIVFLCLMKGVKSFGKVVYFTATFPYLVLLILLIRALTMKGASLGIEYYLTPQWHRLLEARVWGDAAIQIFFSLSPCWGGLITLASYNRFHNNCYRDALIIAVGNSLTSILAGFVIFSIIGFMAYDLGVKISDVADQGAGLAFVIYPEAVTKLPISPLWSILFFFMLITLGLGTQFTILETVVSTIIDEFPQALRKKHKWVLLAVCICGYLIGLICCTRGGMYILQLLDNYAATWSALIIGLMEAIVLTWIYGANQFLEDIEMMLGKYPWPKDYWKIIWKFVTPGCIISILIFTWIDFKPAQYGSYVFPQWASALGWSISFFSVLMIPLVAGIKICLKAGPIIQRLKELVVPSDDWGPALPIHKEEIKKRKSSTWENQGVPLTAIEQADRHQHSESPSFSLSNKTHL